MRRVDRHRRNFVNRLARQPTRTRLGLQSRATAINTEHLRAKLFEPFSHGFAFRLGVVHFEVSQYAEEFFVVAVEQLFAGCSGPCIEGRFPVDFGFGKKIGDQRFLFRAGRFRSSSPGSQSTVGERETQVRQNQFGVKTFAGGQPLAASARAVGAVETKSARLDLSQVAFAIGGKRTAY